MAVPAPSIKPLAITGGVMRTRYVGAIGVAGVATNLNIDLTAMEEHLRTSKYFTDQLIVEFQAIDAGITSAGPVTLVAGDFHGTPIEYVTLQVTSDNVANQCAVTVTLPHSVIR